jgi:hypothetical protein
MSELYSEKGNYTKALDSLRKAIQITLGLESGLQKKPIYWGREFMMYE